jgi:hypothetical protein
LIAIGVGVMIAGLVLYAFRQRAWRETAELSTLWLREEHRFDRWVHRRERWLLRFVHRTW